MADWDPELFVSATASRWDSLRGTASVALLLGYGADLGLAPEICLAHSAITAAQLEDPDAEIRAHQELTVIANLVAALGDAPGLGLDAGLRYGLQTYGIFGFAVLSSATLRDAIVVAERFRELAYALVDVHVELVDGALAVVLDDQATPLPARRFAVERDAAAIALLQRELFARGVTFRRVTFAFGAPSGPTAAANLARYVRAFGVMPEFDAARHSLVAPCAGAWPPRARASARSSPRPRSCSPRSCWRPVSSPSTRSPSAWVTARPPPSCTPSPAGAGSRRGAGRGRCPSGRGARARPIPTPNPPDRRSAEGPWREGVA